MFETEETIMKAKGGFIGVFLMVLVIFIILPLFPASFLIHMSLQVSFIILILSTICTLSSKWVDLGLGVILALPYIFFNIFSAFTNSLHYLIVAYFLYCFFLFFSVIILAKRVLSKKKIDTNLVFGAITIYLLTGIIWSKFYFLVEYFLPHSFHGIEGFDYKNYSLENTFQIHFDLLYFSFTTLATLGLGDINPLQRFPKSLTIFEAMFGQLFVATVISKTVSIWRKR